MTLTLLLFHDVFVREPGESGFSSPGADRYKLSVGEFDAQLAGLCVADPQATPTAPEAPGVQLTFDDGGLSYYTIVAEKLEERRWRGYCLVSSAFIGSPGFLSAAQIRELDARGHIIGTHSASHPARFSALTPDQMRLEWIKSREVLEDLLGHRVTVGSVPGGYFSKTVARSAGDAGLDLLFTSEPVRTTRLVNGCTVAGRFTVRRGAPPDLSQRLVHPAPWTRRGAWISWNAKGLVKPLLGASYPQFANWIQSRIPNPYSTGGSRAWNRHSKSRV
jgi:peptidoglycan/xylan/chitin deacetylase (PgdA/CDA1 family)